MVASMTWTVPPATGNRVQTRTISVEVNPGNVIPEISFDNNVRAQTVTVVDNRADLGFTGDINVTSSNVSVNEAVIGQTIRIRVNVTNEGWVEAMGVMIKFSFIDSDNFVVNVGTETLNFNPNQTRKVDFIYAVGASGVTIGNYTIKVTADSNMSINETNELNNFITRSFVVNAPTPSITISLSQFDIKPDSDIVVSGVITN